jgi:hypothetical protein
VRGGDRSDTDVVCDADEEGGARAELVAADREAGTGDGGELALILAGRGAGQQEDRE